MARHRQPSEQSVPEIDVFKAEKMGKHKNFNDFEKGQIVHKMPGPLGCSQEELIITNLKWSK